MYHQKKNVLQGIVRQHVPAGVALIIFSFVSTILNLVPPIFMMQLSERVMLSRNGTTLLFLTIIALFLIAALTGLESIRSKALARLSVAIDAQIGARVFDTLNRSSFRMPEATKGQVLSDLSAFREFIGGPIVLQLLDLFWVPLLIIVMFVMHPLIGLAMTLILAVIVGLSAGNQWAVGGDVKRAQAASAEAFELARAIRSSIEATRPMGMLPALVCRWRTFHTDALGWHHAAASRSEWWTLALRLVRNSQLILLLAIGALLYMNQQITAGAVFGVIYIAMRVVGPVVAVTANSRPIWNFVLASERLNLVLCSDDHDQKRMSLPRPKGAVAVSRVVLSPPNGDAVVLGDVSFSLQAGRILGVVGPSGAGKSSLAKLLVGVWRPRRGTVHLDDNELGHWDEDELGQHIGYVPQEIDLLPGTVAENIARFDPDGARSHEAVLQAAQLAGIEDVIRDLSDGYNTRVGADGHVFSGGQRQRIALARALYGNPALVVLDEPNSNLDAVGEQTLGRAMMQMKGRGATIVLVTHRTSMLRYCDDLLVMNLGTVHTFGPRDVVMNRLPAYRLSPSSHLDTVAAR